MKFKILACFLASGLALSSSAVDIDFSSGGYNVKKEEIKDKIKYEHRSTEEIEADLQEAKDEKKQTELEKIFAKQPWRKIIFKRDNIVTGDFVNASSNSLIITVLDRERIKRDNVKDPETIRKNYSLNLMLFPGDKFHETNDGKNGIKMSNYVSAYRKRDELLKKFSLQERFKNDIDKDGLTYYEEVNVTNIVLKLEEADKNVYVSTNYRNRDSDGDGISDFDEIRGTKGCVTDPIDPDTDDDGIPDGADKSPLIKCKSANKKLMPQEWVDYLSNGDENKDKKLSPAAGDPDEDGLTNEQEKIFSTDPLTPDQDDVIFYPKKPLMRYNGKGAYIGILNIYLKRDVSAICELYTSYDDYGQPENLENFEIKHISSRPIGWKPSATKKLFNKHQFTTKYLSADIQPKTIYSFLLIYKGNDNLNVFGGRSIKISVREPGKNPEYPKYPKAPFFNSSAAIQHNRPDFRWSKSAYFPPSPDLIYPTNDFIFSCVTNEIYKCEHLPDKYLKKKWYSILRICPSFNLTPSLDPNKINNPWTEPPKSLPKDQKEYLSQKDKYERNAYLWYYEIVDPDYNDPVVYSDIRIMFKEDRISEDHPLVFKGNTEKEILEEIEKRYEGTVVK